MNKHLLLVGLLTVSANFRIYSHERGIIRNDQHDPIPQFMVANFFNILIQGATAITAETKEDQIKATANALNSISNLAQLVFRSSNVRLTDEEHDMIHNLSAKLYKACINDPGFISNINQSRKPVVAQIANIMKNAEVAVPHDEHAQTD